MPESPTTRTLKKLRTDGYTAAVVEHWNPHAGIRQDLFGFIDVLAVKNNQTLAVQCTTSTNVSKRVNKIADSENIGAVRDAGWSVEVWGWRKVKNRWACRVVDCS